VQTPKKFNYSSEDIQNFYSMGICSERGFISEDNSVLICNTNGVEFEGKLFHITEFSPLELRGIIDLINSNNGPTK
jgi:hypothetical protein